MNQIEAMRIYAAIDMDACRKNIDAMLAKLRPETKMTLVIKTDAYGHGALPVARLGETLDRVWGYDFPGETRTVDMHIKTLRQKLGPDAENAIVTVRSVGYKLESE